MAIFKTKTAKDAYEDVCKQRDQCIDVVKLLEDAVEDLGTAEMKDELLVAKDTLADAEDMVREAESNPNYVYQPEDLAYLKKFGADVSNEETLEGNYLKLMSEYFPDEELRSKAEELMAIDDEAHEACINSAKAINHANAVTLEFAKVQNVLSDRRTVFKDIDDEYEKVLEEIKDPLRSVCNTAMTVGANTMASYRILGKAFRDIADLAGESTKAAIGTPIHNLTVTGKHGVNTVYGGIVDLRDDLANTLSKAGKELAGLADGAPNEFFKNMGLRVVDFLTQKARSIKEIIKGACTELAAICNRFAEYGDKACSEMHDITTSLKDAAKAGTLKRAEAVAVSATEITGTIHDSVMSMAYSVRADLEHLRGKVCRAEANLYAKTKNRMVTRLEDMERKAAEYHEAEIALEKAVAKISGKTYEPKPYVAHAKEGEPPTMLDRAQSALSGGHIIKGITLAAGALVDQMLFNVSERIEASYKNEINAYNLAEATRDLNKYKEKFRNECDNITDLKTALLTIQHDKSLKMGAAKVHEDLASDYKDKAMELTGWRRLTNVTIDDDKGEEAEDDRDDI